jgi:SAM-dependent methyltransferase
MHDHFARIARLYRNVRTTDEAPIRFIRNALDGRDAVKAADIGCGAGRYDLFLFRHIPNLHLTCVDVNQEMLSQLSSHLHEAGIRDFEVVVSSIDELELKDGSLDCVFAFNAVHHFDFQSFLSKSSRAIGKGGWIFIYTRTPAQNARSIWGRHFPGFREKEDRLYSLAEMERLIERTGRLRLVRVKTFRYPRVASLQRLLKQARSHHYSTFSLYPTGEFDEACRSFEDRIRRSVKDIDKVEWQDENTLLQIG